MGIIFIVVLEIKELDALISNLILWVTAIAIFQYTIETKKLKEANRSQINYNKKPLVKIINSEKEHELLRIKNIFLERVGKIIRVFI